MGKRITRRKWERQTFGSGYGRTVRADDGDSRADGYSRSLDALRIHPDRVFIVIRGVWVRNRAVRKRVTEVAISVRPRMPVNNRVRVIGVSLMRVECRGDASRHERRNDEAGENRTPREVHVKFALWVQCEGTVKLAPYSM